MKKRNWSLIWEMLFTYLAISKVIYWYGIISAVDGFAGIGIAVLNRLLNQDLIVIAGVLIVFFLDRRISLKQSKHSTALEHILFYAAGYVIVTGVYLGYWWILGWFFVVNIPSWAALIFQWTLLYFAIMATLAVKHYFKTKEKKIAYASHAPDTENRLEMLKVLLADGILTKEEFEQKKGKLLGE